MVGLHCSEEVHQSGILGERSNLIEYKTSSSSTGIYTTTQSSLVENFKHGWHGYQHGNHFWLGELYGGQVSWTLQTLRQKLDLQRILLSDFFFSHLICHTKPLPQNNFTLGWNSRPTGTLLCHILKWLLVSKLRDEETPKKTIASSIQVLCHRAYLIPPESPLAT